MQIPLSTKGEQSQIDLCKEFVRLFLMPASEINRDITGVQLAAYVSDWYTINKQPVTIEPANLTTALIQMSFITMSDAGNTYYNIRKEDIKTLRAEISK